MRTVVDPQCVLAEGLAAIRDPVPAAGRLPARRRGRGRSRRRGARPTSHADRTALPFVTLDPAASRDLDQAFAIEAAGSDLLLHYAIADVGWFVPDGGAMDAEAWVRGTSQYLPDGKVAALSADAERGRGQPAARRRSARGHLLGPGRSGRRRPGSRASSGR